MNLPSKIAAAALVAGAVASAYFSLIEYPKARAANIATAEACAEAKGVDCGDINMATLKHSNKDLHTQLEGLGIE